MSPKNHGTGSSRSRGKTTQKPRAKKQPARESEILAISREIESLKALVATQTAAAHAQAAPGLVATGAGTFQDALAVQLLRIRTQLAGVLGSLDLLTQRDGDDVLVRTARDAALTLLYGVGDACDLLSLERSQFAQTTTACSPKEILGEVGRLLGMGSGPDAIELDYGPSEGIPGTIIVDATRLRQVLFAVGDCVRRLSIDGPIRLGLRRECDLGKHCWIGFEITAVLSSPKLAGDLRESFLGRTRGWVEDASLQATLNLARRIGEEIGWQIVARTPVAAQVVLGFTLPEVVGLPRYEQPASAPAQSSGNIEKVPSSDVKQTILVVEDDPVNRKVTGEMVRRLGYEPRFAVSGEEALVMAGSTNFDLVLLDLNLPGMDGFDTARALRHAHGLNLASKVPILALTANAERTSRRDCERVGIDDVLAKPIRLSELGAVLRAWLPGRI